MEGIINKDEDGEASTAPVQDNAGDDSNKEQDDEGQTETTTEPVTEPVIEVELVEPVDVAEFRISVLNAARISQFASRRRKTVRCPSRWAATW